MTIQLSPQSILGPEGRVAQKLARYEHRPQQLRMAEAVAAAISAQEHLVVEAGTGTGKSFAYLVPAILAATEAQQTEKGPAAQPEKRRTIVISTHTISLQEQLVGRDIPFLNAVLPVEFSTVLVKGRSNYVSLRRLKGAVDRAPSMFAVAEQVEQLEQIVRWSRSTPDGSLSSMDFKPLPDVWDEVHSDHGNCLGKNCPLYEECHYYKSRRRIWNADLLVVNHALFFSDLALRRQKASILPDYDVVILDEAHTLEQVAADHLGVAVSSGQIDYLLNKLYHQRTGKGLLTHHNHVEGQKLVTELRDLADDLFHELRQWFAAHCPKNGRVAAPPGVRCDLATPLLGLAASIDAFAEGVPNDEERIELSAAASRASGLAEALCAWLEQKIPDAVYWFETTGRNRDRTELNCVPIEIGPILREELFNKVKTVVLTSATLAVAGKNFRFLRSRLGLDHARELQLDSPFDFRKAARIILPAGMPDPSDTIAYEEAVCRRLKKYVEQTQGRAFVLFTAYRMLESCARRLSPWLTTHGYSLYSQADGTPRTLLLDRFRRDPKGVLFGADSFWQGVDVPGEALQNVIICKLPFSVPDHPVLEARLETIRAAGGNPFMEYQLPEAIIKLKQGFGRLIRSTTDFGQVVILDPRITTKQYGRQFLQSLPDCEVVTDDEE
jgi:ATP-dependent DNA helicase DinG